MSDHDWLTGVVASAFIKMGNSAKTLPPLFVIGSGRSGNALVRRVILASEQMFIPPETYVIGDILETWPRSKGLEWQKRVWLFCAYFERHRHFPTFGIDNLSDFAREAAKWTPDRRDLRSLIDGFYRYLSRNGAFEAARWGEKSPWNVYHLPAIGFHYSNAYYLWLTRDGRDSALSYVEAKLYPDLQTASKRWAESNAVCSDFATRKFNVRRQKYEDLVTDPEGQFAEVFEWAGLDFDPSMLTKQVKQMGDVEALEHHANVARPISSASVGRWKTKLLQSDIDALPAVFHRQQSALGYE